MENIIHENRLKTQNIIHKNRCNFEAATAEGKPSNNLDYSNFSKVFSWVKYKRGVKWGCGKGKGKGEGKGEGEGKRDEYDQSAVNQKRQMSCLYLTVVWNINQTSNLLIQSKTGSRSIVRSWLRWWWDFNICWIRIKQQGRDYKRDSSFYVIYK